MKQSNEVLETMLRASALIKTENTPNSITISVKTELLPVMKDQNITHMNEIVEIESKSIPSPITSSYSIGESNINIEPCCNQPADLSNKKPENLMCVPEIDFIKDEVNDNASEYSNSTDPERLEVDMSQVKLKL